MWHCGAHVSGGAGVPGMARAAGRAQSLRQRVGNEQLALLWVLRCLQDALNLHKILLVGLLQPLR